VGYLCHVHKRSVHPGRQLALYRRGSFQHGWHRAALEGIGGLGFRGGLQRTGLYALEAFQRANGNTLATPTTGVNRQTAANASIGDGFQGAPSASRSMFAAGVGIIHRF
jgi:hypothetical protein